MIADGRAAHMAVSVPVITVWANPKTIMKARRRWLMKARAGRRWHCMLLHLSLSTLAERVNSNPATYVLSTSRRGFTQQAEWIDKLNLPGINLREESRRFYRTRSSQFDRLYQYRRAGMKVLKKEALTRS